MTYWLATKMNDNYYLKMTLYIMQVLNEPVGGCIHVPPFEKVGTGH
jgi:hypothetical protein